MNKNKGSYFSLIIVSVLLAASFASITCYSGDDADDGGAYNLGVKDFTDYIPISTPADLANIGRDSGYPLDGKYYLADDIVFGSGDDTNGGVGLRMSVTVASSLSSGKDVTVTVTVPTGGTVYSLYVWVGSNVKSSVNQYNSHTVKVEKVPSGEYPLVIGGLVQMAGQSVAQAERFAYSATIDIGANGNPITDRDFNSNGNFTPIGHYPTVTNLSDRDKPFTGTFDGNGKEIKGMNVAQYSPSQNQHVYAGLFGYLGDNAQVLDLTIGDSCSVTAAVGVTFSLTASAGGIAGYSSAEMTGCTNKGKIYSASGINSGSLTAQAYAGGLAGLLSGATMTECHNEGPVTAISDRNVFAGGIAGYSETTFSLITGCSNEGTVTADTKAIPYAGGMAGYFNSGQIIGCSNDGTITSVSGNGISDCSSNAGGITGRAQAGGYGASVTVADCLNTGTVSASISEMSSSRARAGGIIGFAGVSSGTITITGCINEGQIKAPLAENAYAGGIAAQISPSNPATGSVTIIDCSNKGTVEAGSTEGTDPNTTYNAFYAYAGGIAGYSDPGAKTGTISKCYNEGTVKASASAGGRAGGIAGSADVAWSTSACMLITDCYNVGDVKVKSSSNTPYAGGILGVATTNVTGTEVKVVNCYSTGHVDADTQYSDISGGIVGYFDRRVNAGVPAGPLTLINCYYLEGKLTGQGSTLPDVICSGTVKPKVYDGGAEITPTTGTGAKTATQLKPTLANAQAGNSVYYTGITNTTVEGWDFQGIWTINTSENNGYPVFAVTHTIVASAGSNGSISPSGAVLVATGGDRTFTIAPNAGHQIDDVVVNGISQGAVTSYTFTNVTADTNIISATFKPITYTITASAGPNGLISPSGAVSVTHGGSQSFTFAPAPGYALSDVKVNGTSVGPLSGYTFSNVTGNQTIVAEFDLIANVSYTITVNGAGAGGSFQYRIGSTGSFTPVTGNTITNIPYGSVVHIEGIPNTGYSFAWTSPSGVTGTALTVSNVTSDSTVTGTFTSTATPADKTDDGGGSMILIVAVVAVIGIAAAAAAYFFLIKKP